MLFVSMDNKNTWWEFNKEKMTAYNYRGGHHSVSEDDLAGADICEYQSWHELYLAKHFCPLEVDVWNNDVWISPEGKFYDGNAHEVTAEDLIEIIYGGCGDFWAGDRLESHGWVRATTSLMWDVRFDEWREKVLTQKQYGALLNWCTCHKKEFPKGVKINRKRNQEKKMQKAEAK